MNRYLRLLVVERRDHLRAQLDLGRRRARRVDLDAVQAGAEVPPRGWRR
ncbi:MAG TPA: hypothetical protein VFT22_40925 [Kofleriaceae bacterium]|nr:hypothetical protein [Kofleriaceae bacterium]